MIIFNKYLIINKFNIFKIELININIKMVMIKNNIV